MNFDLISIIIFIVLIIIFLYLKRKEIATQKIIFPFLYLLLYRTNFGLKFMEKTAKKYRELIKTIGYCSIGIGFIGMIFISYSIIATTIKFLISPRTVDTGVALVLPGTTIPGVGYLSFWHWIIAIFVLAIVHEFGHGIVSEAHNLKVKSSGFAFLSILFPIIPAAFVEPDEKKIREQPDYVQYSIFAAGPMSNIALAFLVLLIISLVINPIGAAITNPTGFSFDVKENFPAANAGLKSGMIINSVNYEKISNYNEFIEKVYYIKPNEKIILGTKDKKYEIIATTSPDNSEKGFIGISNFKNEVEFKEQYKPYESLFKWIAGLFKWLFLLNLFVGLFNLLPLGIVDGGRMLQILLHKTIKNIKKANKIWVFISFLILGMLLFGLAANYIKQWFF